MNTSRRYIAELDAWPMKRTLSVGGDLLLRGDLAMAHFVLNKQVGSALHGLWFSEHLPCCEEHAYYVRRADCTIILPPEPGLIVDVVINSYDDEEYDG
ncbi:MAG: hypothetical protein KA604_04045 [Candidatus Saccharimonas sp.]|nr:hypothetical protein [Candidatus Saccharimonas sp.]